MKPIRLQNLSETIRKNCMDMLDNALKMPTLSDKFNLSVDLKALLPELKGHAYVTMSARAYSKLLFITMHEDKEVAVHGTVYRRDSLEQNANFFVDDIFVYPQEVTATFAEATDAYGDWLARQPDEIFNHMRFQAHSHVRMGVSPSGVDTTFYNKVLLDVRDFYIFMILNKNHDFWCEIFDVENNIYYESRDVTIDVEFSEQLHDDSWSLSRELKEKVKAQTTYASGGYGYNYNNPSKPTAPVAPAASSAPEKKTKEKKQKKKSKAGTNYTATECPGSKTPQQLSLISSDASGRKSTGLCGKDGSDVGNANTAGTRVIYNPNFGSAIKEYTDKVHEGKSSK